MKEFLRLFLVVVFLVNTSEGKNPFSVLASRFGDRNAGRKARAQQSEFGKGDFSSERSVVGPGDKEVGNSESIDFLRDRLSNVRITTNSRDDVVSSAINMVSSVSSALIYFYLVRTAARSVRELIKDFTKASLNTTASAALPAGFERRYIPQNVTLNDYEMDILGSSVVDPADIDTDFESIGGLHSVKQGLVDCCELCFGLDFLSQSQIEPSVEPARKETVSAAATAAAAAGAASLAQNLTTTPADAVVKAAAAAAVAQQHEAAGASENEDNDKEGVDVPSSNTTTASTSAKKGGGRGVLLRPVQGVLLHGPPGCGKTALTRSLGKKCGLPIVQLSPSTLLRKWVGDTSQLTKAIFTLCQKLQPCILFIDEMDGLFRSRREDDNAVDRQVKTEFMQLWDELGRRGGEDCRVLVVGATNRPQDLDAAIRRRFERSYQVGMPDRTARQSIIRKLLASSEVEVEAGFDYRECAAMTAGYSPSDIVNLFKAAACLPIRELQQSRRRKRDDNGDGAGKGDVLSVRALSLADVEEARQTLGRPASQLSSSSRSGNGGGGREDASAAAGAGMTFPGDNFMQPPLWGQVDPANMQPGGGYVDQHQGWDGFGEAEHGGYSDDDDDGDDSEDDDSEDSDDDDV